MSCGTLIPRPNTVQASMHAAGTDPVRTEAIMLASIVMLKDIVFVVWDELFRSCNVLMKACAVRRLMQIIGRNVLAGIQCSYHVVSSP